jgi:hypothetical protein
MRVSIWGYLVMLVLTRLALPMVALGAIAAAVPAGAVTPVTYTFDLTNAPSATVQGSGSGAGTIKVTASAWNANLSGSTYTISSASLGRYDAGLGVTSSYDNLPGSSCGNGDCNTHQIDNMGNLYQTRYSPGSSSIDFIELDFTQAVSLSTVSRTAFSIADADGSGVHWDDDFSYAAGTPVVSGATLSASDLNSLMTSYNTAGGCSHGGTIDGQSVCLKDKATINSSLKSNVWYIAASVGSNYGGDGLVDAFKLSGLTVSVNPMSAPEPTSWAMMVFGFGAVGYSIRRKRGLLASPTAA